MKGVVSMNIMASLFNACDPIKPPREGTYVDCSSARGGDIVYTLARDIRWVESQTCLLFSGHSGSGKSTELRRLCERLENPEMDSQERFLPIYIDSDDHVSPSDPEVTEILLAIVGSVAETLRDKEDICLESSYLESRWNEFKDILTASVDIEKTELSLAKFAKFTVKLKQAATESRRKVRAKLAPQLPSLIDEINLVLSRARVELVQRGYKDLVLVIDNLEKIPDVTDYTTGEEIYHRLFITGGQQLGAIEARIVLTLPLSLIHSSRGRQLAQNLGEEPIVLPMVKVEEKDGKPYNKGLELIRTVLRRRFESVDLKCEEVFDSTNAFDYICRMSGGHVRNLLMYFRSSLNHADSLPITEDAVRRGVRRHINAYSRSIPEENWKFLARLHLDPDRHIPRDDVHHEMLRDLTVLEYINGGEPWYAVNPVVRELEKFKRAVQEMKKVNSSETDGTKPINDNESTA